MSDLLTLLSKNKAYRCIAISQFVSLFGAMFTSVALPYQIYHLTHSILMIGLLSLFQLLPLLFTALLGGALADRHHRQTLLIASSSLMALCSLVLALNSLLAQPSIFLIFISASFASALLGLNRPASAGLVQQIVQKKDFFQVGVISTFTYSMGSIAGPAIGGLIIAHFGVAFNFFIDFACFLTALLLMLCIPRIPKPLLEKPIESVWSSLKEGLHYARSRQVLLGTYYVDFIAMIFGMPNALFPVVAAQYGGAETLGLLYAAPALGALIITFFSPLCKKVQRQGLGIAIAASAWGLAIILFGLSNHIILMLFFLALAGAADAVSGIFRSQVWNDIVPNQFRSRLAGIEMISYLSGPKLGDTESGLVASSFGVTASIVSGGVLCILGVAACCYFLPQYYRYKKT